MREKVEEKLTRVGGNAKASEGRRHSAIAVGGGGGGSPEGGAGEGGAADARRRRRRRRERSPARAQCANLRRRHVERPSCTPRHLLSLSSSCFSL